MAATVVIHCWTGSPLSDGGAITGGVDLCSADNCAYSSTNRIANPIIVGDYSYEKWLRAHITADPDHWIGYFKIWGDGEVQENTVLKYGSTSTAAAPTDEPSTIAVNDFTSAVEGSKGTWDATVRNLADLAISPYTDFLVFQLYVNASATPGDWTPETVYYEYQEA